MLRTDCIGCSLSIYSRSKDPKRFTVCHARLTKYKAPWLQRLGNTMLSFNWRGRAQENTSEESSAHLQDDLQGGGSSDQPSQPSQVPNNITSPTNKEVTIIYENQRWMGTWQPPVAILDIPLWTDAYGNEIALTNLQSNTDDRATLPAASSSLITESPDWEMVITPSTDTEGWQYATVFKHLQYKRPGGRASQRFGDTCRRRAWRKRGGAVDTSSGGNISVAAISLNNDSSSTEGATINTNEKNNRNAGAAASAAASAAAAAAKARETEAKNKAIRGFVTMILDLLSRRNVWTLVPWDPSALFFLYKKHQEIYQQLQQQASQRQIFAADSIPPPSMLHRRSQLLPLENNTKNIENEGGTATLLQDLLCAAMHSRAAYGFAMAAGHITSVTSYIKLQTVQPLTFNAVAGASIEANNEAVAALAGIAPEDILYSMWKNFPFRPCHYVAIDRVNRCVVISIRGTLEIGDLLSDLAAHPMEIQLGGVDGWVHPGILAAASYIHCTIEAALKEAAVKCPGWPVLITGHSLGGGVAALLCMLLRDRGGAEIKGLGSIYAITVGSAAVMSESLAAACEEYVISLVLGSDVIPHLSYASVERLLIEASEASPVRRVAEGLKKKLDSVLSIGGGNTSIGGINNSSNAVSGAAVNAAASGGNALGLAQLLPDSSINPSTPPLVPIIDLSNTNPDITTTTTNVPSILPVPSGVVVPVLHEEDISILNYGSIESDGGLATAAMAQNSNNNKNKISSNNKNTRNTLNAPPITTTMTASQGGVDPDPELLFPPGRILWIFPADEDMSSLAESTSEDALVDEEKMEEAWDAAWEQGRFETNNLASGTASGGSRGGTGEKRVNIDEAEAQVAALHSHTQSNNQNTNQQPEEETTRPPPPSTTVAPPPPPNKKAVPVVVEADRSAFERLLLMPDSLNDHLPHRILEALQQL
jgi:hypothetical protein